MFKQYIMVLVMIIGLVFLVAFIGTLRGDIKIQQTEIYKAEESIAWKYTKHGTKYYIDCINGVEYIGTKSSYQHIQFAYTGVVCGATEVGQ